MIGREAHRAASTTPITLVRGISARSTPPVGFDRGTQLGKVTLAGGFSDGTAIDLSPPVMD
jgi:hypothetical protein